MTRLTVSLTITPLSRLCSTESLLLSTDIETEKIFTYICDVSKLEEVVNTAERIRKEASLVTVHRVTKAEDHSQAGHPTIIVNNAGVVKGKLLLDLTEEDIIESAVPLTPPPRS